MSGHSKWANIKHKKELNDKNKGTVFGKMSRKITLAVVEGGGVADPEHNVKLRLAIEKAKSENLPKDNIDRAIEKGLGPDKNLLKEVVYEGFDKKGVGILIETTTDNPNRTLGEIRNVMERHNAKLGSQGSVSHMFKKCGTVYFLRKYNSEEDVFRFSDRINAIDIDEDDREFIVYFPFENLGKTKHEMGGLTSDLIEIIYRPTTLIPINDERESKSIQELMEALEELEDVHRVFVNAVTSIS